MLTLHAKFRLTVAVASVGLLMLSVCWLRRERAGLISEKQEQARNLVSTPYSIIEQQYRLEVAGKISRTEAQKRAAEIVSALRYNHDNYYWINDLHPAMVMHPIKPQLNGKDLTTYTDPSGKALFLEMVRVVQKDGEGFVRYQWPRPGSSDQRPVAKLSFVRVFKPWGWVIGTGIYVDDVDSAWRASAATAATLGLLSLAVLLLVSASISRSIFPRLRLLVAGMNNIATNTEDLSRLAELAATPDVQGAHDEIGVLLAGFRSMLREISERDSKIRRHREELEELVSARTAQLRTTNADLAAAHAEIDLFLQCIPSILIGLDVNGRIKRWNLAAAQIFGIDTDEALGRTLNNCGVEWLHPDMGSEISKWLSTESILRCDDIAYEKEQRVRFVGFSVRPIFSAEGRKLGSVVTGTDVTERKCIEEQLRQAHKLEAIGQLAAGVAHEINTPTQYVGDNATFLKEAWQPILSLLDRCRGMQKEATQSGSVSLESLAEFDRQCEQCDLSFLVREIPKAIDQSLEGLQRVAKIVRAMKEFSHPGTGTKDPVDLNEAVETTITLAHCEWKDVAELDTDLAPNLPLVNGVDGELKQVILNLIVNAAQAIREVVGNGPKAKGKITIRTRHEKTHVEISIADTGRGIPDKIQTRVFEPFFTTKPVGQGTGQGLALAHSIIVKQHQGKIWFETKAGEGTTFFIRLPLQTVAASAGQ